MTATVHFVRRKALDHMIGFLVCTLLVIFAVGAKVAMYHPTEPGTRPIAAAKAWSAKQMMADTEPAVAIVPQAELTLITLLSVCVVLIVLPRTEELPGFPIQMHGPPSVAVRPPPAY